MPPLAKHTWSFRYLLIGVVAIFLRSVALPILWLSKKLRRISLEGVDYARTTIPSRQTGRSIIVDIYRATTYNASKPTAVLINMHGSGFIIPALGSDRKFCSFMATHTNCFVFDIDYRKAPENPFPAALHDVQDVVFHLTTNPTRYDLSNLFLSGFSAGGNLALSASMILAPGTIKGVIAAYPPVDCSKHYTAPEKVYSSGGVISPRMGDVYYDAYILPDQSRKDPRISPLFSPPESFPKHLYFVCGRADSLYEPVAMLAHKIKDAGHEDVTFRSVEHEAHSFDKWAKEGTPSAAKRDIVYAEAADMINRTMSR